MANYIYAACDECSAPFKKKNSNHRFCNKKCKVKWDNKQYYKNHKDESLAYSKRYYHENEERRKEVASEYYAQTKEKQVEYVKQWQKDNPERTKEIQAEHRARHGAYKPHRKQLLIAHGAKRKAQKLTATPKWYDHQTVVDIYKESDGMHVHHIVPLQADGDACGLHCGDNLVALTPAFHIYLHSHPDMVQEAYAWTYDDFILQQEFFLDQTFWVLT